MCQTCKICLKKCQNCQNMSNLLKNVTYRRKVSQNVGIEADQEYQYTETNINTNTGKFNISTKYQNTIYDIC